MYVCVPICAYACVCVVGKVVLASTKAVYVLVPLPLEQQIQDLLSGDRVEEALVLTEGAQPNIPRERFEVCVGLKIDQWWAALMN